MSEPTYGDTLRRRGVGGDVEALREALVPERCCVEGCPEPGDHWRTWTLSAEGWGEITVEAVFCCRHFDNLSDHGLREGERLVDLRLVGVERE